MEINFDEEFNEFMWTIGRFLREKGYVNNPAELFCAATVAAWSLQHEQSKLNDLVKDFKRKETQGAVRNYVECYKELQVIAAQYGREIVDYGMSNLDLFSPYISRRDNPSYENYSYLNDLLLGLHHFNSNDVYVEYGCGTGNSLLKLASKGIDAWGVEFSVDAVIIAEIKAYWMGRDIRIVLGDMDEDSVFDRKADKSTVDAAFFRNANNFDALLRNKYLQPYTAVIKKSGMRSWTRALIAYQKNKNGRVIALATQAALFNNADKELRKTMINQGIIEGIIELPAGVLPTTNIAPVLLILSKGNSDSIKMMDAKEIYRKNGRDIFIEPLQIEEIIKMYDTGTKKCRVVTTAEIKRKDYILSTNIYAEENVVENGVSLVDICDGGIERGATIKAEELDAIASDTPTKYQCLMLQDIVDGKISNQLPYISGIDKKYESAVLRNNDIVISKITPFKICLVQINDDKEILANGNLFKLTVNPNKMNPVYVMLFLRSQQGLQELTKYAKGASMRTISIKDLKLVQIPMIDMAEQNRIAQEYNSMMKRLMDIDEERQQLLSGISTLL